VWYLRNSNSTGAPDIGPFEFGAPTWTPLVGDWTGKGHTGIGAFDPATGLLYIKNDPGPGAPDAVFPIGLPGMIPVAGNFFGLGHSGVGVVDPATMTWYLKEIDSSGGLQSVQFSFGAPGWRPVVGDWNGTGVTTVGAVAPDGTWYLRNSNSAGAPDQTIPFGLGFWTPVAGHYPPVGQPLRAAGGLADAIPGAAALDDGQLQGIVSAALTRLGQAGVAPGLVAQLAAADYEVAALPAGTLGLAQVDAHRVLLSPDAAGHGWFVDATPLLDEEFASTPSGSGLVAPAGSPAAGKMDLLTVVLHEMDHLAGRGDEDSATHAGDLMADLLPAGVRRTQALDAAFASL
jgi:hypothetical protein